MSVPPLMKWLHPDRISGVLSIVLKGKVRMIYFAGWVNRDTNWLMDRDTCFPTASVSKMFTALCLARLVETGLCDFAQPIGEILPSWKPCIPQDVTLGDLLSHRSGLGDYIDDEAALPFAGLDVSRLDCLEAFRPLLAAVPWGERGTFRYTSAGYLLLGFVIEELTGLPFPEAMAQWLTGPAGMNSTGFPRYDVGTGDLALGYMDDGTPNLAHVPIVGGPDGGIVTNLDDLLILHGQLRSGALLRPETLDFLLQPVSPINERVSYGYGFYLSNVKGQSWYGHTGSDPGISARVAFSRNEESSVIVLCNRGDIAFPIYRAAIDLISSED